VASYWAANMLAVQSSALDAVARNSRRRRRPKKCRKHKGKTVIISADPRVSQHHGYNTNRLRAKREREERKKKDEIGDIKPRKRSHRAIQRNRHIFFTESDGAHCISIKPTRVEAVVRVYLRQFQIEHADLLAIEYRNSPMKLTIEFMDMLNAMVDALVQKIVKRIAMFAEHRQSGRSKSSMQKKANAQPRYMGKITDANNAWGTIVDDAKH